LRAPEGCMSETLEARAGPSRGQLTTTARRAVSPPKLRLRALQVAVLIVAFALWHALTSPDLLAPFFFENPGTMAFFCGEPAKVLGRIVQWFTSGSIYSHLWITLVETLLSFVIGALLGLLVGLWLALSRTASGVLEPYIKAANAMPRVILAPIFALWF